MAAIRKEAYGIGKDNIKMKSKAGVEFTIKGHTVEAVLSEMRPLLDEHGVDLWPYLVDRTYAGNRCDVTIDWTFERTDESDETRVIRWAGAGTDDGDKGFSKAGTNCLKEMLKKTFLITDRDDAQEETVSVEHRTEDATSAKAIEVAKTQAATSVLRWASAFKAAVSNCTTADDVKRIERENRDQLTSEALPDVTRTFLIEMLEKAKKDLP